MAFTLDQEQVQLYKDYGLDNEYSFVSGTMALPVATANTTENPVDLIQVHAPYRIRTVKFSASKNANPPVIPSPQSSGAFTFLGGDVVVPAPTPTANNQFQWQVGGEYTFVCSVATSSGLILGNRPMIFEQQAAIPPASNGSDLPADVQLAGRGVITGHRLGSQINLNDPMYLYPEISYLPPVFFSSSMVGSPESYPNFS